MTDILIQMVSVANKNSFHKCSIDTITSKLTLNNRSINAQLLGKYYLSCTILEHNSLSQTEKKYRRIHN